MVELLGLTGWDFVIIDMEHAAYTIRDVEAFVRAAEAVELAAFVRVLVNDEKLVMQALDAGAVGVLVPHVTNAAACAHAVAAARLRPYGIRGKTTSSRAAGWGTLDWSTYADWTNSETLIVPIIEDPEGVDSIEEIVRVEGLELVALGPGDLAIGYGEPTRGIRSTRVSAALDRLIAACRPIGVSVMTIPTPDMSPALVEELARRGATVAWYGGDLDHLARLFARLRAQATEAGERALSRPPDAAPPSTSG